MTCPGNTERTTGNACPAIREVISRVGDKWTVLVIRQLAGGTARFSQLRREVEGISQRMLTLTLKALERDGLVTRTVYPTVPPRVEYTLTDEGRTLLVPIIGLAQWAMQHQQFIQASRDAYDARAARAFLPDG